MTISFEEYEKRLEQCHGYVLTMRSTRSESEFKQARTKLVDLTSDLRSSSGKFTPSHGQKPRNSSDTEKMLRQIQGLKAEAEGLRAWAVSVSFGNA
jgi:hypothetical protein